VRKILNFILAVKSERKINFLCRYFDTLDVQGLWQAIDEEGEGFA
jgi:hypothetical protein